MKKRIKLLLTLVAGFAIAMLLMGIFIYFGYAKAYETDVEVFAVKILGLPVYQLTKAGSSYVGEGQGIYMGIFCGICMGGAVVIEKIGAALRKRSKNMGLTSTGPQPPVPGPGALPLYFPYCWRKTF